MVNQEVRRIGGAGVAVRNISRTWQQINDFADDATSSDAFDSTVNTVLNQTRGLICNLVKNKPSALIDNPFNTGLTNFWESALRCDLPPEDRPKPPEAEGQDEACLRYTGGQKSGVQYVISVSVDWVEIDNNEGERSTGQSSVTIGDVESGAGQIWGKLDAICIETRSGTNWAANVVVKGKDGSGGNDEKSGNLFNAISPDSYQVSVGSPYSSADAPLSDPDFERIITSWSVSITEFDTGEEDDEGEPEEDSNEPPIWDEPDPDVDTDIDINIPKPDNYPDWFPDQTVNVSFNPTTNTFEGDDFNIEVGQDGLGISFDALDPPKWLTRAVDTVGDIADFASDVVPAPFNLPFEILSQLQDEEGETEEPIDVTFTVARCQDGEIVEEEQTYSILPSQETIFAQLIETRNKAERINCRIQPYEAIKITVVEDTVRGQARFGDTEQQTRKFFGWLQFTKDGEMIGDEVILRYDPQIIPFNKDADDYLVQAIDGAELADEVIVLDQEEED